MYLDHTFARKTFAQQIGSAKVKSKSEVTRCYGEFTISFIAVDVTAEKMAVKHHKGKTETLDSYAVRTIGNSSSLQGICSPILALPDGLVKTTTTTRWLG